MVTCNCGINTMLYYPFQSLVGMRLTHLFHCEGGLHRLSVNFVSHFWLYFSIMQHSEHYCLQGPQRLDWNYEEVKDRENLCRRLSYSTIFVNLKQSK